MSKIIICQHDKESSCRFNGISNRKAISVVSLGFNDRAKDYYRLLSSIIPCLLITLDSISIKCTQKRVMVHNFRVEL